MSKLWAKIIIKHRIRRQITIDCSFADVKERLNEICREFDIPCPIWLGKQEREFDTFRLTSFSDANFVEDIDFQKLEIEYIEDSDKKRRNNDPRNAF